MQLLALLLISASFHLFVFVAVMTSPKSAIVYTKVDFIRQKHAPLMAPSTGPGVLRLDSDGPGPALGMDKQLSAQNYLERVRALVEPPWLFSVRQRIKIRQVAGLPRIGCTSTVLVTVLSSGALESTTLLGSCASDVRLDEAALAVWRRNLPPPPKNLLIQNKLELLWKFAII